MPRCRPGFRVPHLPQEQPNALTLNAWEEGRRKEVLSRMCGHTASRLPASRPMSIERRRVSLSRDRLRRMRGQILCIRIFRTRTPLRFLSARTHRCVRTGHAGRVPLYSAVRELGRMACVPGFLGGSSSASRSSLWLCGAAPAGSASASRARWITRSLSGAAHARADDDSKERTIRRVAPEPAIKTAGAIPPAAPSSNADTSPPCAARRARPDRPASSRASRRRADRACSRRRSSP